MLNFEKFHIDLDLLSQSSEISFSENESMSLHSSFKTGGNARFYITPKTAESFAKVIVSAKQNNVPVYVLGKGTNVLFDDNGYEGAIVSTLGMDRIDINDEIIECGAGASLTGVSVAAMNEALKGMSFAYGIPASIGGAVFMNAGAYTGEIKDILLSSTYLDLNDYELHELASEEHEFSYRTSSYKSHPERIIISAKFKLEKGSSEQIKSEMEDFMMRRRTKQPLEYPNAGSTFKRYPGRYTAQMIDELGLKGYSVGGAEVSTKHAGFVINKGGATSADVKELIHVIQKRIKDAYGIDIEREVIYVPEK